MNYLMRAMSFTRRQSKMVQQITEIEHQEKTELNIKRKETIFDKFKNTFVSRTKVKNTSLNP